MINGFLRVGTANPVIRVADPEYNADRIIEAAEKASESGVRVLVFPELCVTGYTCADLFTQSVLVRSAENALKKIAEKTAKLGMLLFVGLPVAFRDKLYDCAAAVCGGKVAGVIPKTNLSSADSRYFTVYSGECAEINVAGSTCKFGAGLLFGDCSGAVTVSAEIGEDTWLNESAAVKSGALVLANPAADSEGAGKAEIRRTLIVSRTLRSACASVYACAGRGESTTDSAFSGHGIIAENGDVLAEREPFDGALVTVADIDCEYLSHVRKKNGGACGAHGNIISAFTLSACDGLIRKVSRTPFVPEKVDDSELTLRIQSEGLGKRMTHVGAKKLVLGVSGGLDSALALLVCVRTLDLLKKPHTDLEAISMPCFGTSERTAENALALAKAVGASHRIIDIKESVTTHLRDIGHDMEKRDVAYENAQARMRTMVLMGVANATGGIAVGTGDLSEEALGWCTYNGDHMSMYGVNASVPKTLVKRLVRAEAERLGGKAGKVLLDILDTEISPELLPGVGGKIAQKTEDIIGSFELNDFFLYYAVMRGCTPEKTLAYAAAAFGGKEETYAEPLAKFYGRFFAAQFKRSCSPDGVSAGRSLSPRGDWLMPSDACVNAWIENFERKRT